MLGVGGLGEVQSNISGCAATGEPQMTERLELAAIGARAIRRGAGISPPQVEG